jgi:RNA polymerase sigma factor (sigma-70 family)
VDTVPITSPEQLFTRCRRGLYVMAFRVLHNQEDAEDCLQEAALRMVRYWHTCNPERAVAWALTIVRNQALDTLRRRRVQNRHAIEDFPNLASASHEGSVIARLTLAAAIARLTETEREALALWMDHRRSVAAVGPRMHSRQYRALHRLRHLCRGICLQKFNFEPRIS